MQTKQVLQRHLSQKDTVIFSVVLKENGSFMLCSSNPINIRIPKKRKNCGSCWWHSKVSPPRVF
ncbi:hypothetical protein I3843_06G116400 [Carya illinoinensis]|nr:hypothetical protein I3843_06G116400 [Carya illinoinensis]